MALVSILIVIFLTFLFAERDKDSKVAPRKGYEKNRNIEDRFNIIVEGLNQYCYQGNGRVKHLDSKTLSIYKDYSCQIVYIRYVFGEMKITWKFKYFQQEMIYEKHLDARNPTHEWQVDTLKMLIVEFLEKYKVHEARVNASGIPEEKLKEVGINVENYEIAKKMIESWTSKDEQ